MSNPVVFTIGHSNLTADGFRSRLRGHEVDLVVDVRRYPSSRRHPHFSAAPLAEDLAGAGIGYRHLEDLGGRREGSASSPHRALHSEWRRHYADHMESALFGDALSELERLARVSRVAVMCAEADPVHCHRSLLADALLRDDFQVHHILDETQTRPHELSAMARIVGTRIVYDGGVLPLDFNPQP